MTSGFSIKRYERSALSNYEVLSHQLGDRPLVQLEGHTILHKPEMGAIAVRLHDTDILTFTDKGLVTLNTGGWYTMFTDQRMNKYAPDGLSVSSDRGKWMLFVREGDKRGVGTTYRFYDGITVDLNTREVVSADPGTAAWDEWNKSIDKKIKAYLAAFDFNFFTGLGCNECGPYGNEIDHNTEEHILRHVERNEFPRWVILAAYDSERFTSPERALEYDTRVGNDHYIRKHLGRFLRKRLYKGVTAVR